MPTTHTHEQNTEQQNISLHHPERTNMSEINAAYMAFMDDCSAAKHPDFTVVQDFYSEKFDAAIERALPTWVPRYSEPTAQNKETDKPVNEEKAQQEKPKVYDYFYGGRWVGSIVQEVPKTTVYWADYNSPEAVSNPEAYLCQTYEHSSSSNHNFIQAKETLEKLAQVKSQKSEDPLPKAA